MCSLHVACARRAQHELRALVAHLPLEFLELRVERLRGLDGLGGLGHLRRERSLVLVAAGAAYRWRAVRLGVFVLLRPFRLFALPLLDLRFLAMGITRHVGLPFSDWPT